MSTANCVGMAALEWVVEVVALDSFCKMTLPEVPPVPATHMATRVHLQVPSASTFSILRFMVLSDSGRPYCINPVGMCISVKSSFLDDGVER